MEALEDRLERIENALILLSNLVEEGEWANASEQVGNVLFDELGDEEL